MQISFIFVGMEAYNSNGWKLIFIEYTIKNNIAFKVGRNSEIEKSIKEADIPYYKYGSYIDMPEFGRVISPDCFHQWEWAVNLLMGIK